MTEGRWGSKSARSRRPAPLAVKVSATATGTMDFSALVAAIRATHAYCAAEAKRAVNVNLTLRNWLIGWYIVEYEQNGADRAEYGDRMVDRLSAELHGHGVPTCDRQRLYAYAAFYRAYPQVRDVVPVEWTRRWLPRSIGRTRKNVRSLTGISHAAAMRSQIVRAPTGQCQTSGQILVERLSYSSDSLMRSYERSAMQNHNARAERQ